MDKQTLTDFKTLLSDMLQGVEDGSVTTVEGMRDDAVPFPDPTDRAALESDRNLTLRIRDRERKLRNKIEEALARIEEGAFGVCEICEGEISVSRLKARPVTTLCIQCKEDQEEKEVKHHLA